MFSIEPVILRGRHAVLEPLAQTHLAQLQDAAADGELWKLFFTSVPAPDRAQGWLDLALAQRREQHAMPFAVGELSSGKIVGSTRFCNVDPGSRRLEIGHTWYAQRVQRTAINTECKLLLLTHAFEALGCIAVEFRTDWLNPRSQAAIERLGAKRDGVLRSHKTMPDGRIRDTVVYSILEHEWPGVKLNLRQRLERG